MALRDQPYLPLYIQDIMTDEKLNECSAATHGIYIKGIMCLMHKSESYGKILLKQKHKQNESKDKNFATLLAKHLPYTVEEIYSALTELINEKVCFYEGDYLVQKRMVKDNEISEIRANAGKKGGFKTQNKSINKKKKIDLAKIEANSEYENDNKDDIINYPFSIEKGFEKILRRWIKYKTSRREKYKTNDSLEACYNKLLKLSDSEVIKAEAIIEDAIASNYAGFFALKPDHYPSKSSSKIHSTIKTFESIEFKES